MSTTTSRYLKGTEKEDVLSANEYTFNYTLDGKEGDDALFGNKGHDVLIGGAGNDKLEGGGNDDLLIGGSDLDVFYFNKNDGHDVISDFKAGEDIIQLNVYTTYLLPSTSDYYDRGHFPLTGPITFDDLHITYENGNTVIEVIAETATHQAGSHNYALEPETTNVITLLGTVTPLTENDFIFGDVHSL